MGAAQAAASDTYSITGATESITGAGAAQAAAGAGATYSLEAVFSVAGAGVSHVFGSWYRRRMGSDSCARGALSQASPSGNSRCGRPKLDLRPFHILRDGGVDNLLHGALGIALLQEDDLGRLGLGVNVARPAGAVVRRRRNSAPDGELLVAPPCSQTSFTSASSRARLLVLVSVCSHVNDGLPLGFGTIRYHDDDDDD